MSMLIGQRWSQDLSEEVLTATMQQHTARRAAETNTRHPEHTPRPRHF